MQYIVKFLKSDKFWTIVRSLVGSLAAVVGVMIAVLQWQSSKSEQPTILFKTILLNEKEKSEIAEFNRHPKDFKTLRFLNRTLLTKKRSTKDWKEDISPLNPGDELDFAFYYHNNAYNIALNTKAYLNYRACPNFMCANITATLKSDNSPTFSYSKKIFFTKPAILAPIYDIYWRPHQTVWGSRDIKASGWLKLLSKSGFPLGDVRPGLGRPGQYSRLICRFKLA